uniref:Uncharacterized protein n=1 Tax=Oryzias latipes TaxID=8090 RepID=A0A3P9K499_ORYLA
KKKEIDAMMMLWLKLIIFLASFLSKRKGQRPVYKFVRCNPNGDQANCVVQQTPKMPWSPELPSKLPASTAQYLYVCMFSAAMLLRKGQIHIKADI